MLLRHKFWIKALFSWHNVQVLRKNQNQNPQLYK